MQLVASGGTRAVTARAVAEKAGVTPGLIRHHFGSMAGLLEACDRYVAETVSRVKGEGVEQGLSFDVGAALRDSGNPILMGYLAKRLSDDVPAINDLVDQLVSDAVGYLKVGQDNHLITPADDEVGRAAMLTLFSLGSLSLYKHLQRYFDIDITAPDLATRPGYPRYLLAMLDATGSVFEPQVLESYRSAITQLMKEDLA